MRVTLITADGSVETREDFKKLFNFKTKRVVPAYAMEEGGDLVPCFAWTFKTSKRGFKKFQETRERYGF